MKKRPVINPNKPKKIVEFVMLDRDVSLNDMLLSGSNLLQILIGIITRLREHSVAMTVHVEARFLQAAVPSEWCRFLRFKNIQRAIKVRTIS